MGRYVGHTFYRDDEEADRAESGAASKTKMDKRREALEEGKSSSRSTSKTPIGRSTSSNVSAVSPMTNAYTINKRYRPGVDGPSSGLLNYLQASRLRRKRSAV